MLCDGHGEKLKHQLYVMRLQKETTKLDLLRHKNSQWHKFLFKNTAIYFSGHHPAHGYSGIEMLFKF